ncbi:16S rRNA (adenine(1518)-N(6)/adenine(1519)-N(6))-dimethyltransferase RsmA [Mycoplasmopsis gallopavonis]|uniref:Ribosomal RNA small subunit methyltransferase A n=1 Tax=Mycoplasmopsis gallopavonis TaxID=76629 RepID=A0A449AYK7_9BACT|nr:16S rRNA (adenine(1518)-N(6)/adenine(1519)-N(6))-dimethyltransferase RsmA [Mycoplasmopsis gallopavonis]RIV16609.1 16S rRNA (adenine(1518)-N(6)/adenine(1519)-N(6))-dimethyltransferase RsmA [Mycoplasmopsis gallopavonis]VEU72613.1 dimethyladenosine transferase(S-adenosylmethionine-6-N', N'-adenosyl(rRNA)dimethyltransferase) (16S rRNA dimethylase) (high levelkasugamycin resistance protein ksgA) (kasugamycindimethyltransferase) [Mycoplasmopsis gallopavonis]
MKKEHKKPVFAKKEYGQNFLQDKNFVQKIVNVFPIENEKVLEIGPGRGALTQEILKKAQKLTAFEIDPDMIEVLTNTIDSEKFDLIHQDFLKANLDSFNNTYILANIPYYITTDILFKIFENREKFKGVLLMVQKEVAERIVANKQTKEYSKLSVSAQYLANCKIEFIVPKTAFAPAPKIDSAIISLVFKKQEQTIKWDLLKEFFKLCFLARRKKLSYALKTKYSSTNIENAYQKLGYTDNLRIQELSVDQIVELYNLLESKI